MGEMAQLGAHNAANMASPTSIRVMATPPSPASASALSADTKVAENCSVEPERQSAASSDLSSTLQTSEMATSGSTDTSDGSERREDGYVTPPLRVGYPSEFAQQYQTTHCSHHPHQQQQQQQLQLQPHQLPHQSSQSGYQKSHGDSANALTLNVYTGVRDEHATGIFTPILCAAQPAGGILSPTGNKRKRIEPGRPSNGESDEAAHAGEMSKTRSDAITPKRKVSSDYLRKGQWTVTEEKFARALIDAFEEGYLPIYTGIRLRGYLAVQLQCDPMRVSKKLCGGSVDGKKIPKNYGQKKFKLRKKQVWDQVEAERILATLEKLMHELWHESGIAQPPFLTLSSTRSAGEEFAPSGSTPANSKDESAPSSPEKEASSVASMPNASRSESGSSLPIIYLNLSKKLKKNGPSNTGSSSPSDMKNESKEVSENPSSLSPSASSSSRRSTESSAVRKGSAVREWNVDGDSLQAAYELLKLFQA